MTAIETRLAEIRARVDTAADLEPGSILHALISTTHTPALLAAVEAALGLHRPDTVLAVTGDCALEDCDHEDLKDCETVEVRFCAACNELAEEVDPYYAERGMVPVAWPCPTITALTAALEVQG